MLEDKKHTTFDTKFESSWEDSLHNVSNKSEVDKSYVKVSSQLHFNAHKKQFFIKRTLKYAAIFIGVIMIGYFAVTFSKYQVQSSKNTNSFFATNKAKTIELLDQSTIQLAENSTLTYLPNFNKKDRQVELIGSAYFTIKKDTGKPFIIHNNNLNIKVLGTTFSVIQDTAHQITEVRLLTGSIEIYDDNYSFKKKLVPGNLFKYNYNKAIKKNHKLIKKENTKTILAQEVIHQNISISFENTNLQDAYTLVSKKIGVPIITPNLGAYKSLKVSLEYHQKPVTQILKDLNSFGAYTYQIKNNSIIITR